MSRIPFQPSGYTDGTSEGCKPSPLYTGPHCTCHLEVIDGVEYAFICSNCAFESAYVPNPHEPAGDKGGPGPKIGSKNRRDAELSAMTRANRGSK